MATHPSPSAGPRLGSTGAALKNDRIDESPTMKFPQLPLGQRFRWRQRTYRKTGPMVAHAEDGGQPRMIPRSAVVEPLDNSVPEPTKTAAPSLSAVAVNDALVELCRLIEGAADELGEPQAKRLRALVAHAQARFRSSLEID